VFLTSGGATATCSQPIRGPCASGDRSARSPEARPRTLTAQMGAVVGGGDIPQAMNSPDDVVVVVVLHVLQPPDFVHFTRIVCPSGLVVLVGLQSGLFGSALVQAQVVDVSTPPEPPVFLAVTITVGVTRRCPGRKTIRTVRGRDVRRR
jgi:hypothetical protein